MTRETQRFVGRISLWTERQAKDWLWYHDRCNISSLPMERNGWIATLQTTERGGVF